MADVFAFAETRSGELRKVGLEAEPVAVSKMELPPERAAGRIIGEGAAAVPELVRLLREEAKVL